MSGALRPAAETLTMGLLSALYVVVVVPVGLLRRAIGRVGPAGRAPATGWVTRPACSGNPLHDVRRQF